MTIKALYPTVRPTLNLDFAKTKALDPRVTFTRASTGTFVGANGLIQTAASGAARFDHNPATGESLGLLVEEARTNVGLYSQFGAGTWINNNATRTVNSVVAPDGTTTGTTILANAGGTVASRGCYQPITVANATVYTYSIYAKAGNYNYLSVPGAGFNIQNGTVLLADAGVSATITPAGNGWFRCTATATTTSTTFYEIVYFATSGGVGAITATGTETLNVWGAQLEAGSFPTSYIPTTTATVTRAADVASMTGTNFSSWFNRNNGTLLCNAQNLNAEPNPPLILTAAPYYQGAGGYKLGLSGFWSNISQLNTDAWANGVGLGGSAMNVSETQAASATIRHSFAYSPTECRACVKQTLGTVGGSQCFQAAQGLDRLLFQQYFSVTSSRINRITYYPVRLPDAQLQALTAT